MPGKIRYRNHAEFLLMASALTAVRDRELFRAKLGTEEIEGMAQLSPERFARILEWELSGTKITPAELDALTSERKAVRLLLFIAHEAILGIAAPKPLSDLEFFGDIVREVRYSHEHNVRRGFQPTADIRDMLREVRGN